MQHTLDECRWLYNHLLEQRKTAWKEHQESLSMYEQINEFPRLEKERSSLASVHSQVLQNVAMRIDLAFKAFFRRVKAGDKPGYPRFRGAGRYDSFTYPQSGYSVNSNSVTLSKIGTVKAIIHRPVEGKIKTCCVRRTSTAKWFVSFACEVKDRHLPESHEAVGIDVGLETFATLSTGGKIANPRFFRTDEKALAKAQHKLSKEEKGTPTRAKKRKVVAHIHESISNRRMDFAHQNSRRIINRFGIIAVEDLRINRMIHNHRLAKSIADAAWGQFAAFLKYKAESAGRKYIAVNPAYTSQDCSQCGHRQLMALSQREFHCPVCGLVLDRDLNASLNILAIGLDSLGLAPRSCHL
jgi:putative transposase